MTEPVIEIVREYGSFGLLIFLVGYGAYWVPKLVAALFGIEQNLARIYDKLDDMKEGPFNATR